MVTVIGCHDGHNASACLLKDGELVYAIQEERLVNRKNEPGMPVNAINYIIEHEPEIDLVALATLFIHEAEWYKTSGHWEKGVKDYYLNKLTWPFKKRFSPYFTNRLANRKKELRNILFKAGVSEIPEIQVVEHHTAHAAAAYYSSPFDVDDEVLIITADGSGDGKSASVNKTMNDGFTRVAANSRDESPGEIYSLFTYLLGFKPWEHEYKLMGMAPYAKPDPDIYNALCKMMKVYKGRFMTTVPADFAFSHVKKMLYRKPFDWSMAALQKWFEELMVKWILSISDAFLDVGDVPFKLACGGGDFMNVKANQLIMNMPEVEEVFFMPSAGDESTSIGAAMQIYADYLRDHGEHPKRGIKPIGPLYLGPPALPEGGLSFLDDKQRKGGISYSREDSMSKLVAELLDQGNIVARCSGNLEFGARALGNRSIMADARDPTITDVLNSTIKHRSFWMPFTPSILTEYGKEYLVNPKGHYAPYMNVTFDSKEKGRQDLGAAMHRYDKTVRPQMVEKTWNPGYWSILKQWERRTAAGGFLNTSFNLHGSPIVKDVYTAIHTLENSDLEFLVVDDYIIEKTGCKSGRCRLS